MWIAFTALIILLYLWVILKDKPESSDGLVRKDFVLNDVIRGMDLPIKCFVDISDSVCFNAEGYGDHYSQDGQGCPVMIRNDDGILKVYIWDDINADEPRIISLANARESNRK